MTVSRSTIVWLATPALNTMHKLALEKYPVETGGLLMGYIAENGDYVVVQVIGPGPNAVHHARAFIPDHKYQQSCLEDLFLASNGEITYLGDWHTLNRPDFTRHFPAC